MNSVSVITICYNNLEEVIKTCATVDSQSSLPYEHWIIDGSTTSDINSWLINHPQPTYRKWIFERDNGIADAFNKGIIQSSSTITHLLNSGDKYWSDNVISTVQKYFDDDPNLTWTYSKYVQHRGGINVISGAPFNKDKLWKGMRTVAHPTMFIKKELYNRYGFYDIQFKVAMDYDFLVRIRDEKFAFIHEPLIYFAPGGASNIGFIMSLKEVKKSYFRQIGPSYKLQLWQLRQKALNIFMKTAVGKMWFKKKNKSAIPKSAV